jgi:hypothetical protein
MYQSLCLTGLHPYNLRKPQKPCEIEMISIYTGGALRSQKSPFSTQLANTRARIRTAAGSLRKPTLFPFKQLPWERKCSAGV